MLENLVFCLNATLPIFLLMVLGYFFKRVHIIDDGLAKGFNSFVFKIALPVLVYKELATSDIRDLWDTGFIVFCFLGTVVAIAIGYMISLAFKDRGVRAEFIQGSFRSSAALLGVGIVTNLYGNAGMVPLMIIGAVPLYNMVAVIVLTLGHEDGRITRATILKTLKGIITNPIIIGIILGVIRAFIPHDLLLPKTVGYVSSLATPLGLMALGASFEFSAALREKWPTIIATAMKLVVHSALLLPIAAYLGYTNDKLVAILIMTGSPTTVSCFVMAKNMGHEGTVSAGIVMLTTLLSAFTLTGWLYVLRCWGYI